MAAAVKPALELVAVRESRGMRHIEQLVLAVTEATGLSPEEFEVWAKSTDGRLMLSTSAIQAAYNTTSERKVWALAAVLAENLEDDAQLDLGILIVGALADLEPAHVRVLHAVLEASLPPRPDGSEHVPGVVIQSQLEEGLPHLAAGIRPIMATLVRHGIAEDALAHDQHNAAWRITPFGRHCLTYLQDNGPEAR
ncbi:hypothetical protein [Micromonospora chersina]|uniref:hypothetical protein n=1 Tax=Micromonospora chersina TaxID=47854 RepID=UPI0033E2F392